MKLAPPIPSSVLVPRHDTLDRLTGQQHRLVLVSAPAGWGKSSLLAAWHRSEDEPRPFAFVRLDPEDSDSSLFWSYVIEALRTIQPELMAGIDESLRSPGFDPLPLVIPNLVNELVEADQPVVLVLDDYQTIAAGDVHRSVAYFVEHLPPSLTLVLASRADPPLPLGQLRASGDMVEIRADQLRFDDDKAAAFLDQRFGVRLDADDTRLLVRRTEGWPAGLQLAGISLEAAADRSAFVQHFAGDDRNVADYLVGEVLAGTTPAQRAFLLRTSILDELGGSLCDAVADVSDSDETLRELERGGLFVLPLDTQRRWYRYHRLFADWLAHELGRESPELIPELHGRASAWYAEQGSHAPAIDHAIAAGDHHAAARLLDGYLSRWHEVHWSQVKRWLDQLPDTVVGTHSMTAIAHVWLAFNHGDFDRGVRWLDAADAAAAEAPEDLREPVETAIALYRALTDLIIGDMESARRWSVETVEGARPARAAYTGAIGLAGVASFWTVGPLEAIPYLTEAKRVRAEASLDDWSITPLLALAHAEVGDWAAAEEATEEAFGLRRSEEAGYPSVMFAHYAAGKIALARGDRDAGVAHIQDGLRTARGWVDPIGVAYGYLCQADASTDYAEKRALVREARQLMQSKWGRGRILDLISAAERRLALRRPSQHTEGTVHVGPLTDRELDVLRLLRSDLSQREIAGELDISLSTVKSHTKSIYRKLGVSSRTGAVEAASDLDLV